MSVKRIIAAGMVEERMLHLRKRSRGLIATDEATTMAVSRVDAGDDASDPASSGDNAKAAVQGGELVTAGAAANAAQQPVRDDELRYLYGCSCMQ